MSPLSEPDSECTRQALPLPAAIHCSAADWGATFSIVPLIFTLRSLYRQCTSDVASADPQPFKMFHCNTPCDWLGPQVMMPTRFLLRTKSKYCQGQPFLSFWAHTAMQPYALSNCDHPSGQNKTAAHTLSRHVQSTSNSVMHPCPGGNSPLACIILGIPAGNVLGGPTCCLPPQQGVHQ
jgi:hypothetical protein